MAENCTSQSLHTRHQVVGSIDHSNVENQALDDESRPPLPVSVGQKPTAGLQLRSKGDFTEEKEIDDQKRFDDQTLCNLQRDKTTAVCFSIEMDNTYTRAPPKRFLAKTRQKNTTTTLESLNDKQIQAEIRRKQRRQEKLQRIHDREEAARKLAENVDILLRQRELAMGTVGTNATKLSTRQIMATANEVAKNFRELTKQLNNDLTLKERLDVRKSRATRTIKNEVKIEAKKSKATLKDKARSPFEPREKPSQNVSFTVDISSDLQKNSKRPVLSTTQRKVLTIEDIEEKQRLAEERRNERKERRIKRVKENREALMKMAVDLERFETLQKKIESSPVTTNQVKERALLAEKIAEGFDRLSQRYNEDLKRAENFFIEQPFALGQ